MIPEEWDYELAEEAFACGHEPRVVTLGDGTRVIMTSWANDEYGIVKILNEPHLVQELTRYRDDLDVWCYTMTEYDPLEYKKWAHNCREARAVIPAPSSYRSGIKVPDFIGAELWEEFTR
jgi:hypothetical protein